MDFRITDTFTDSLARLTGDEQKTVKTTAFDLQLNPANPGMSFHKLDKAKDKNFWSVRVGSDIRLIVHKTQGSLLLCYVDHHDKAYDWAERRKLETHPKTGAAQLVEIRETVQEIVVPKYVESPKPAPAKKLLFAKISEDDLLNYGVPAEWMNDVRQATDDTLLTLADHLPSEAAEALLELATGGKPRMPQAVAVVVSPFDHPDAQRRFRVMAMSKSCSARSNFPGTNGQSSFILNSDNGWNGTTPGRREFLVQLVQAKQSWPCIERCFWPEPAPTPEFCSQLSQTPSPMHSEPNLNAWSATNRVWQNASMCMPSTPLAFVSINPTLVRRILRQVTSFWDC